MSTTPKVTIFSPEELHALVQEQIQALPDGHTHAVIGTVDQDGAQVVVGAQLGANGQWTVEAAARHAWTGENEVGARVILSW